MRHDLAKDPPDPKLLARWIERYGLEHVLNRRSPTYKRLELDKRHLTTNEAVALMQEDPNLIRRPILVVGDGVLFGFSAEDYDNIL